jgi:hypothetical protein
VNLSEGETGRKQDYLLNTDTPPGSIVLGGFFWLAGCDFIEATRINMNGRGRKEEKKERPKDEISFLSPKKERTRGSSQLWL